MRASPARALALAGVLVAGACDLPTSSPEWEGTWEISAHTVTLSAGDFVPHGISVSDDGEAFVLEGAGAREELALEQFCGECRDADGSLEPKPAFSLAHTFAADFPGLLRSASVVGGEAILTVNNHLSFDPIRPGEDATGTFQVSVVSDGDTLAVSRLHGSEASIPAGRTVVDTMELRPGTVRWLPQARLHVESPEGDTVRMDSSERFSVEVGVRDLRMDRLEVRPSSGAFELEPFTVGTGGIDDEVRRRVDQGHLRLATHNPFESDLVLGLRLEGSEGGALADTVDIPPGDHEAFVEMEGSEARELLEGDAVLVEGQVGPAEEGQDLEITPDREFHLEASLAVEVVVGAGR